MRFGAFRISHVTNDRSFGAVLQLEMIRKIRLVFVFSDEGFSCFDLAAATTLLMASSNIPPGLAQADGAEGVDDRPGYRR